ncbi:MAG: SDR family NAD(P)-dependent oxidoreductase [Myxococcales bacterium FL481]|nr:MAG: SDR family NAD(P)-dependent oxidoreductase [Myxococcales bacterium FL481]
MTFQGRWVLVTGASSGLGREIARRLAKDHRAHLVLAARRTERLAALADELRQAHGVDVATVTVDLSTHAGVESLLKAAREHTPLAAVVLNAGVTFYGHLLDQSVEDATTLMRTNVEGVVHSSRAMADLMARNGQGSMLLVASLTALAPFPTEALYGASKAFITQYGLALRHELAPHGVHVGIFAPGGIATEMLSNAGLDKKFASDQIGMMSATTCAKYAVRALVRRRAYVVPGLLNRVLATLMRFAPRWVATRVVAGLYDNGEQTRWQRRHPLGQRPVP